MMQCVVSPGTPRRGETRTLPLTESRYLFIATCNDVLLKQREAYWIHTLQTLHPKGLNDELQLSVML